MKRLPTDREILQVIYERYYAKYTEVSSGADVATSDNKIYLPVDLAAVAGELGVDGNLVFGRLHYYLDRKYGHTQPDTSRVHLFWLRFTPQGNHWINFPVLTSVLAALQEEDRRVKRTMYLAIGALAVSVAALALSVATAFWPAGGKDTSRAVYPRNQKIEVDRARPNK